MKHLYPPMKVYIADDEAFTRNGIVNYVPWDSVGCQVVGSGANGEEVLDYIADHDIDILVTDIRMPKMDGLQLLSSIASTDSALRVILISAYTEFSYIHAALHYDIVDDYILKPIQPDKLLRAVEKASAQIRNMHSFPMLKSLCDAERLEYDKSYYRDAISQITAKAEGRQCEEAQALTQAAYATMQQATGSLNLAKRFSIDLLDALFSRLYAHGIRPAQVTVSRDLHHDFLTACNLQEITGHMCWFLLQCTAAFPANKAEATLPPLIQKAIQQMDTQYGQYAFCLQSLADYLQVSPSYLSTKFKEALGVNFNKHLNQIRIQHAKAMLTNPSNRISEIGKSCGFQDTHYFSKQFKQYTGQTPKEYRAFALRREIPRHSTNLNSSLSAAEE